ncbi:uncharacterized protein F4822DRAFT_421413 [Hypoxylon trugodes]|uniref:uncharacterized protein n=1 Tax=Hypoxylon trugodes TaxID=326681 RepID=UPI0021A07A63|nr:uncharacterized protein F4822DRAFT_421413 [Hypoxylon trugodes]KAI1383684.1 hypothetical protein F4822DRAFT_421413 [Hypoxylon trugodes]
MMPSQSSWMMANTTSLASSGVSSSSQDGGKSLSPAAIIGLSICLVFNVFIGCAAAFARYKYLVWKRMKASRLENGNSRGILDQEVGQEQINELKGCPNFSELEARGPVHELDGQSGPVEIFSVPLGELTPIDKIYQRGNWI